MDDLNGLDWSSGSSKNTKPTTGTSNYYPSLRPTPPPASSGRATPLSTQGSGATKSPFPGISKPATPANDSFSNLVNFGSSKTTNTLSLQEQQKKLEEERLKRAAEQKKQYDAQFGNSQFWDGLGNGTRQPLTAASIGSRSGTPSTNPFSPVINRSVSPANGTAAHGSDDADLFAAFNADTKVDKSSHYPPPASNRDSPALPKSLSMDLSNPTTWESAGATPGSGTFADDDDPFGLDQMASKKPPAPALVADDDDFLGDLGRPVEEVRRKSPVPQPTSPPEESRPEPEDPWDKAVGEIVDMGFSAEQARRALTENGSGVNVQAAVSWLLNEAHRTAKEKTRARTGESSGRDERAPSRDAQRRTDSRDPAAPRRTDSRSPANGDGDLAKTAAAMGSTLFKTAGSLWKTSQKKVQQAVAEFQQEGDPNQPKWMRDAALERQQATDRTASREARNRPEKPKPEAEVTDEALMLEMGSRPAPRQKATPRPAPVQSNAGSSRDHSPSVAAAGTGRSTPQPRWQQTAQPTVPDPRSRISKQVVEEQSAQAYVSPARRKKATPSPRPTENHDLLFGSTPAQQLAPAKPTSPAPSRPVAQAAPSKPSTPILVRPKAPTRSIPALSPSSLALSTQHRLAGTAHFKRGDYAAAHQSYTTSLSSLPPSHPITIILLCNRSLTAIKTGDPRAAVSDADKALEIIGPSQGENETINLEDSNSIEGPKSMKEFYGKALMRKAEALEQMERWADAGAVWKQTVEAGVGGAQAIQGRQRCEKALAPKSKPSTPKPAARPKPKPAAASLNSQDTEAVKRLREANKAAEKADDEKFALSDSITARLTTWQSGRKDNLRALLGSLDSVLWEGSGWKKVGMHELVMDNKVKIVYMKAIAKVHPDKVGLHATSGRFPCFSSFVSELCVDKAADT
jgi:hypothetical protein